MPSHQTRIQKSQVAVIVVIVLNRTAPNKNSIIIIPNNNSIPIIIVIVIIVVRRLGALQAFLIELPGDDDPHRPAELTLGVAALVVVA